MNDEKLPTNIRQIGTMDDDGPRVYMEDFVCTYLRQMAEGGGRCEVLAYLVGKRAQADGRETLFISGAIQGKHSQYIDGMEQFTEKSAAYAEEMLSLYFPGHELLGWMQSQPGYGAALNPAYADYHMTHFDAPYQVLFVTDPLERLSAFYAWDENQTRLTERRGYIIYYDKNDGFREYMLDNKLAAAKPARPAPEPRSEARKPARPKTPVTEGGVRRRGEAAGNEYRRVVNMLVSLSAVLFIICFIMGAGLIQSDGRVTKLEKEVASLDATYSFLVSQAKTGGTETVFATNDEPAPELNIVDDTAQTLEAPPAVAPEPAAADNASDPFGNPLAENPVAVVTPPPAPAPEPTAPPTKAPEPSQDPRAVTQAAYDTYVVEPGDSLLSISRKFYGSPDRVRDIMALNGIEDSDTIYFGKTLKLPPK